MGKKWTVVAILAVAQFVMVLDSTVMNVSLTTVAHDLGTTISGMQAAITFYTLTMAALMLTGGKLGDIWGRRGAFRIGAIVYGIGSLMTGLAPNLTVLLLGWSLIEGLGAVLVIPAIAALAAVNYRGRDRVIAFAIIGGISGAAAAAGPLIGGFMTTFFSWRYVFIAETIIMAGLLFTVKYIADEKIRQKTTIDIPSAIMSAAGMGLLVYGILQSKTWGLIRPLGAPEINGHAITPFGVSIVAYLILIGIITLWWFYKRQVRLEAAGGQPLLKVSLLKVKQLQSGLAVLMSQYFMTAAIFFVIPVYLQTILGYDALKTGLKILPLSVALILFSLAGTRMLRRFTPRRIVRFGQIALVASGLLLLAAIDPQLKGFMFGLGMFVMGAGLGLLASQLGNVNMSAVGDRNAAEGGGLQGTFQNLGSSLGTALIGSVFIASLTTGFVNSINTTTLPQNIKSYITDNSKAGVAVVSASQVQSAALAKGTTPAEATEISNTYTSSQINGLKQAMFAVVAVALLSMFLSSDIPNKKMRSTVKQ
jgi:MFS family permease